MKINDYQFRAKKRRGLSSVVGALLFVVLMVATFAVLGVALDSQTNIVDTSRQVADTGLKKQQERFTISTIVQLPSDSLQVNVTNRGQNPAEIFTLVITNSSDFTNGYPTQTIDIPSETSFLTPNSLTPTNIVKTLNLTMDDNPESELYQFKIISSLGTIEKLFVTCQNGTCGISEVSGSTGLFAQFLMDGPNGVNTKNSTGVMFVTNTGDVPLTDVAPLTGCTKNNMFTVSPDVSGTADFNPCILDPTSIPTLSVGQTALFKWDGTVTGEIDDEFTFCNQATGTDPDLNPVSSLLVCDEITVIDPNDCGGCDGGGETIILIDDLLIRPSIFMIIPSPFGDAPDGDNYTGLWGINIANPTVKDMTVSKVTIVVYPPGGNSQDTVFQPAGGAPQYTNNCEAEDIFPDKGTQPQGYWNCPRENILMWQSFDDPVVVSANSTESFLVRAEPYTIKTAGDNLDALIIQANVYTDFGSFGKTGYQSSMYELNSPIVNVYMSDAANINLRDEFISHINNIPENSTQTFNVVFADLDDDPSTVINADSKLIINVPREWTVVEPLNNYVGFKDPPSVTPHSDGSTQIIGVLEDPLGDGIDDARKISFDATAPDVDFDRLYIMYVLADGTITNASLEVKTIGPLNEIVLNVDP